MNSPSSSILQLSRWFHGEKSSLAEGIGVFPPYLLPSDGSSECKLRHKSAPVGRSARSSTFFHIFIEAAGAEGG